MRKTFLYVAMFLVSLITSAKSLQTTQPDINKEKAKAILDKISSDKYESVKVPSIFKDRTYRKLAEEGWSNTEIVRLTDEYLQKNRSQIRGSFGYHEYKRMWRPYNGIKLTPDPMFDQDKSMSKPETQRAVKAEFAEADDNYDRVFYTPEDRLNGIRNTGYFRHVACLPAGGRIHWIVVHPEDPDKIMCIPDGDGIWRTDDMGKNWHCVTDKIPNRYHRSVSNAHAIPVDPDDWNHFFAYMDDGGNGVVYETTDGGESWTKTGDSHYGFKKGYAFKDSQDNLRLIGAKRKNASGDNAWNQDKIYISSNKGATWEEIVLPNSLKDNNPGNAGDRGQWIQEFAFDPTDRDVVYMPGCFSILKLNNGGRKVNGKFQLERMTFNVYAADGTTLRASNTSYFPFKATLEAGKLKTSPMFIEIDPNNPNKMWVALASRTDKKTAIYYSEDKGLNWKTIHEPSAGIGGGNVFGNEAPWTWLGGFGVNFTDPSWLYGCSMSSAISSNGGKNFTEFAWHNRMKGFYPDGHIYNVSVSSHNADNHCIVSHKSGRVFRGSDGGMLMKDKNINGNNWTNIAGNMGQMLFYQVTTNEFGNQMLFGNTQDINLQTYRNGRWTPHRGYEGSTAWVSPYGSRAYYPYGEKGLSNVDYGSWNMAYTKADVCSGYWYLRRQNQNPDGGKFSIIKDFGQTSTKLDPVKGSYVADFALARDTEVATLYVVTESGAIYKSVDNGSSFSLVSNAYAAKKIAVNPDNHNEIYIATNSVIYKSLNGGSSWANINGNLPTSLTKTNLIYHEGCGDLYFVSKKDGVFLLEKGTSTWRLWMKGYNPAAFNNGQINYTTQEFIIDDLGRGIWIADLEHPSDRYFDDGFKLKEISNIAGTRTLGIDTDWQIPMYHNYEWKVNGTKVDNPYQYFTTKDLNVGDKVQLQLTLREAPDVSTTSAEYTITATDAEMADFSKGNMLYSDGSGRIDLGNVDLFNGDFTLNLWLNPISDGVILSNRPKYNEDAKGWYLALENGTLVFTYSPDHQIKSRPYNEQANTPTVVTEQRLTGGTIPKNEWSHISIVQERQGDVAIYVDGKRKISRARIMPEYSLNNSIYLSLFADGYERNCLSGSIDEIKIWNKALTEDELKKDLFGLANPTDGRLIYYNNFNAPTLEEEKETFSKMSMQPRTRAKVEVVPMSLPVGAKYSDTKEISDNVTMFTSEGKNLLSMKSEASSLTPEIAVFGYENDIQSGEGNGFNSKYHAICPISYLFMLYDNIRLTPNKKVTVKFFVDDPTDYEEGYIYASENIGTKVIWNQLGQLTYNSSDKSLSTTLDLSNIDKKQLAIVKTKASMAATIPGLSEQGVLNVCEDNAEFEVNVAISGEIEEPTDAYSFSFNESYVKMSEPLHFVNGKATGKFIVDLDALETFNTAKVVTMSGQDDKLIPIDIELVNKGLSLERGNGVSISKGGVHIGRGSDFAALNGKNTATFMGWFRINSNDVFSGGKPILFFRGSGTKATGIYLWDGNIGCHWNDEGWSWGVRSGLKLTSADYGNWIHVAMVGNKSSLSFYLNGKKSSISHALSGLVINSPLMIGQNNSSDTYFTGMSDQVGVWNRALSDQEIAYYMHHTPLLNDENLVVYQNNDLVDSNGNLREAVHNTPNENVGTVRTFRSYIPYNSVLSTYRGRYYKGDATELMPTVDFNGKLTAYYLNKMNGLPPFHNLKMATEKPVSKNYWSLVMPRSSGLTSSMKINVTFNNPAIKVGDSLILLVRPLGSRRAFTGKYGKKVTVDKVANFELPYNAINASSEIMLIAYQNEDRPIQVMITPHQSVVSNMILKDGMNELFFDVKCVGGEPEGEYTLYVNEPYAHFEVDKVDFDGEMVRTIPLKIKLNDVNKLAENPLTISCSNSTTEPLKVTFSLEPKVELTLKNGETANRYIARSAVSDMQIEVKLVQGVLSEKIDLELLGDDNINSSVSVTPLLSNDHVKINKLDFDYSAYGQTNEGWNLIGNPYLSTINLTDKNFTTQSGITRFVYQYDNAAGTYRTYDMASFDANQEILPFGTYFVQALNEEASLNIYPLAKQAKISRSMQKMAVNPDVAVVAIGLYVDGNKVDQTEVRFESSAHEDFYLNEDAPKLFGDILENTNEIYTLTERTNTPVSVNSIVKDKAIEVPLIVSAKTGSTFAFKVEKLEGFILESDYMKIVDTSNGNEYKLEVGQTYSFDMTAPTNTQNRFKIVAYNTTDVQKDVTTGYVVTVKNGLCVIDGLVGNAQILIFDAQGRMIVNKETSVSKFAKTLPIGTYLVKIISQDKTYNTTIQVVE